MAKEEQAINPGQIDVHIPLELRSGVYANTVNVSATNSEITINFVYANPTDEPKGTLVSRVVIPPIFADKLGDILKNINKQLDEKNKEK